MLKLKVVVAICSLLLALPASANMGKKMDKEDMMAMIDENGDGKISASEHEDHAKNRFELLDEDKDGFVTTAEMKAGHKKMKKTMKK